MNTDYYKSGTKTGMQWRIQRLIKANKHRIIKITSHNSAIMKISVIALLVSPVCSEQESSERAGCTKGGLGEVTGR
jgi:hypothetical protein